MPSINSIISNAFTGLTASQAALRTTANNVANVNTPGYARQVVNVESLVSGGFGSGVKISEVTRLTDRFLETSSINATSDAERAGIVRSFHDRLQGLLGRPDGNGNISARLDAVFSSFSDLAVAPHDVIRRESLISNISRFTNEVDRLATTIQSLRAETSTQIDEAIQSINPILEQIHRLNPLISRAQVTNEEVGALLDQRDRALRELSEFIDIRTSDNGDGSITVSTTSGIALVDSSLKRLDYNGPGAVTAATNFPTIGVQTINRDTGEPVGDRRTLDGNILSGKLSGLLALRDDELPKLAENLGELARAVTDEINALHNKNTSVPAANSLSGRNAGLVSDDLLAFTGTTDFAVIDKTGNLVEKFTADLTALGPTATVQDLIDAVNTGLAGAGTLSLNAGRLQFSATGAANGVVIADDPDAPSDRAGRGFSHFFGLNDLLEARSQSHYQTGFKGGDDHGFAAGGTVAFELRDQNNRIVSTNALTISGTTFDDILDDLNDVNGLGRYFAFSLDAGGQLISAPRPGVRGLTLRVLSDSTDRAGAGINFSDLFGLKHGTLAESARDLRTVARIDETPQLLSVAKFDRTAAAGAGAVSVGDARGAAELRDLQASAVNFNRAGRLSALNISLNQYAAFTIGEFALAGQRATEAEDDAVALRTDITERRDGATGVNLDEELSNLIVFQNSYNAAARLISTAQQLYDELLRII